MDKVNELCPKTIAGSDPAMITEDDSQDSYGSLDMADLAVHFERSELISVSPNKLMQHLITSNHLSAPSVHDLEVFICHVTKCP